VKVAGVSAPLPADLHPFQFLAMLVYGIYGYIPVPED
jgi:hypothetical protein